MKLWAWINLALQFLGLIKQAEELATSKAAPVKPISGPVRDETDPDDKFHLNQ